jgi:hypothetical protein
MKVVCLDNNRGNTRYLEVNKIYNIIEPKPDKNYPLGKSLPLSTIVTS